MHSNNIESHVPIEHLREKLLRKGLPRAYVNRTVREVSEHWMDLRDEAQSEAASPGEAEILATQRLGNIDALAETLADRLRQASWWGRHPILGFAITPLFAFFFWWIGIALLEGWLTGAFAWGMSDGKAPEPDWQFLQNSIPWVRYGGAFLLSTLCCYLAWRCFCGFKWAFVGCLALAVHGLLHNITLTPPVNGAQAGVTWTYSVGWYIGLLNWLALIVPLLVYGSFLVLSQKGLRPVSTAD